MLQRIKEIAATRVHYGYRRVHVLLRREGWRDKCKRVYRLYRSEGLSLRHKRPRRNRSARLRQPKQLVSAINEIWSADFVADALFDGRRLRAPTVVDNYTRECLAIEVGPNLKGEDHRPHSSLGDRRVDYNAYADADYRQSRTPTRREPWIDR